MNCQNSQKDKVTYIAEVKHELSEQLYNMNSIMQKLRGNLQYLNKNVRSNLRFRVRLKILSDFDEMHCIVVKILVSLYINLQLCTGIGISYVLYAPICV